MPDPNEGNIDNKNLYNDKELFDDADLDWYDYGFRNYDAQIGRFTQLDPLTWDYPELTNYQYASDEPIANVDMDGLESVNWISGISQGITFSGTQQLNDVVLKPATAHVTAAATKNVANNVLKEAIQSTAAKLTSIAANSVSKERSYADNTKVAHSNINYSTHINYGSQPIVLGNGTMSTSNGNKPDPKKSIITVNLGSNSDFPAISLAINPGNVSELLFLKSLIENHIITSFLKNRNNYFGQYNGCPLFF